MTNEPRPLNRFHFLRLVPKAVFTHWRAKIVFALVLIAVGTWTIPWLKAVSIEHGDSPASVEGLAFAYVCLISLGLSYFTRSVTLRDVLVRLPIGRAQYAYLRAVDGAVSSLIWVLLPALCFLYFSGFPAYHLGWLIILWTLGRFWDSFEQALEMKADRKRRTRLPSEPSKVTTIHKVLLFILILALTPGMTVLIMFVGSWVKEVFPGEAGLYRNPPIWLAIVFAGLTVCALLYCRYVNSLPNPVQPSLIRRPPVPPKKIESKKSVFLDFTDIVTTRTPQGSFLKYVFIWKPVVFWAFALSALFSFPLESLEVFRHFLDGIFEDRLNSILPVILSTFLAVSIGFTIIGMRVYSIIEFLKHVVLACESIRCLTILSARRAYVVASTLMGIAVTLTLLGLSLSKDGLSGILELLLGVSFFTPALGYVAFLTVLGVPLPSLLSKSGPTDTPNLNVRPKPRSIGVLECLIGIAWFLPVFPAGLLADEGHYYLAVALLIATSVLYIWAMAWLWKRY